MDGLDIEQIPEELREFLRPMMERDMLDQQILDVIAAKSNTNGIECLSQYYIAEIVGITQTMVSKHIRRLIKHGFIRQEGRGMYAVLKRDVWQDGATASVVRYVYRVNEDASIMTLPLKEQAERTGLTVQQIQMAQGYISDLPQGRFRANTNEVKSIRWHVKRREECFSGALLCGQSPI